MLYSSIWIVSHKNKICIRNISHHSGLVHIEALLWGNSTETMSSKKMILTFASDMSKQYNVILMQTAVSQQRRFHTRTLTSLDLYRKWKAHWISRVMETPQFTPVCSRRGCSVGSRAGRRLCWILYWQPIEHLHLHQEGQRNVEVWVGGRPCFYLELPLLLGQSLHGHLSIANRTKTRLRKMRHREVSEVCGEACL